MFYKTNEHHGLKHDPFKSLVVPRPIGWVSSQDQTGQVNLAPYSFFNAVASAPPIVMFASNGPHAEGGLKDTVKNIEETGEFVCNIATWELREQMNATSGALPRSTNEFEVANLTPVPAVLIKAPRVGESPVHLECKHLHTLSLPSTDPAQPNKVVFGQVLGVHIADSIIVDGRIDVERLKPIARLGYMDYTVVEHIFHMPRPG